MPASLIPPCQATPPERGREVEINVTSGVVQSFSNRLHIYQEAFRILEPRGWIEIVHVGFDLYQDDVVLENEYSTCSKRLRFAGSGRNVDPILNVKAELRGCGFTDIRDQIDKLPIGIWPKEGFLSDIGGKVREKMASDIVRNGSQILQDWNTKAMLKLCFSASRFLKTVDRAYSNGSLTGVVHVNSSLPYQI
ncbi:hypothetical protein IFR05_013295 [Cadophora sp. M221]|nr:hypothetical protein IFR05_013295 [Cadophora sp. M221]